METRQTLADHRLHGLRFQHAALGVDSARLRGRTRVNTLSSDAGELRRAFRIFATLLFHRHATQVAVADRARRTRAFHRVVEDFTFSWSFARVGGDTRILAFVVDAGTVTRTLGIRAAAHQNAGDLGIADESRRTFAHRSVVQTVASGLLSAGRAIGGAHRDALPVNAAVLARAVVVASAADPRALDLGVAVVALFACAHGLVVLDAAVGEGTAVARVLADAVEAGLVSGTFAVADAGTHGHDGGDRVAGAAATTDVTRGAYADHRPHRYRTHDLTLGRALTGFEDGARVLTFLINTSEFCWTFAIFSALGLGFSSTVDVRVADVSTRAPT